MKHKLATPHHILNDKIATPGMVLNFVCMVTTLKNGHQENTTTATQVKIPKHKTETH